jgi:hypothetical protein
LEKSFSWTNWLCCLILFKNHHYDNCNETDGDIVSISIWIVLYTVLWKENLNGLNLLPCDHDHDSPINLNGSGQQFHKYQQN